MDSLIEELDIKLRQWRPEIGEEVRRCLAELMEMADNNSLDVMRSKTVEQNGLDWLDE
jgi:hypothetical protein